MALFKLIREITQQHEDFGNRMRQFSNENDLTRRPSAEKALNMAEFLLEELDEVRGGGGYSGRGPTTDGGLPGVFAQQVNVQPTAPAVDDNKGSAQVKDGFRKARLHCVGFLSTGKCDKADCPYLHVVMKRKACKETSSSVLCKYFKKGCRKGEYCPHVHHAIKDLKMSES